MTLLMLLAVCAFIYFLGRALVRRLGWPMDASGAAKWGITLLVIALVVTASPEILGMVEQQMGTLPSLAMGDLLPVLVVLGLAALGYFAWNRGAAEQRRGEQRERLLPRWRAAPPAPFGQEQDQHDGFHPLGPHDDDQPPDWP